ncbi:hypothetical protein VP1G_06580 [Cytospora mali]|uniref:Uncharacterized protein n=1 Tax=Cytospora mali TaxID=578113 RepID=A0A194V658_CYTMA|nr:hypothetical protein VP1G_06580 [Valsa mali var. pyri (nom. inval.)]
MVLLGDALSMWKYEYRKSISTVDVFLDPCLNTEHRETSLRCADQVAMALRLPQEWMSDCNKKDFTQEALVNAFKRSVGHVEVPRLYDGAHLEVYAMDSRVAFEMKLRQIQNPDRDTNMDVSEATKLLYEATGGGQQPLSFYRCQKPQYSGGKIDIPDFVVDKVKERFEQLYNKKHGIVYTEYDKTTKRWLYKNMKDDEAPAPRVSMGFSLQSSINISLPICVRPLNHVEHHDTGKFGSAHQAFTPPAAHPVRINIQSMATDMPTNTRCRDQWMTGTLQAMTTATELVVRFEAANPTTDPHAIIWSDASGDIVDGSQTGGIGTVCEVCLPGKPKYTIEEAEYIDSETCTVMLEAKGILKRFQRLKKGS